LEINNERSPQNQIGKSNLILWGCGMLFFALGSYLFLEPKNSLVFTGQYFFILGIALSCIGMISIFLKHDF